MKKIVFSTLTAFFAVGTALLACDSTEETTTDSEAAADSGSQTSVDGSTDTDGSTTTTTDGSTDGSTETDATVDSGVPPTDIEVTVLSDNKPVVGATIVFGDSTGKMTKTVYTDAQGKIKETIAGGEMITVAGGPALPDAGAGAKVGGYVTPDLVTIMGVKPGDKLVVPFYPGNLNPGVDVTFQTSAAGTEYNAFVGLCSTGGGTSLGLTLEDPECVPMPGAPFSVLGVAYGEVGFVGASYKKGQMLAATGNTTVDFVAGTQPASAAWSSTTTDISTNLTGTDSLSKSASYYGWATMISDGMAFDAIEFNSEGSPAAGKIVNGFAESLQSMWMVYENGSDRRVIKRYPNTTTTMTTAVSEFLPTVSPAASDVTDPVRPVMKWTQSAAASLDGVRVSTYVGDPLAERYISWKIISPQGTANEVKLPELPAGSFVGTVYLDDVALLEADFVSNYDQFRTLASVMANRDYNAYVGGTRAAGTVRMSRFSQAK